MRRSISTRQRFEIFKRDSFTCAYCGRRPPAVILNCDHILAVANGGSNDSGNLITSCWDCNSGKSDVPLSEIIEPIKKVMERRREGAEQLREYETFLEANRAEAEEKFEAISRFWLCLMRVENPEEKVLAGRYEEAVRRFLKLMTAQEIMDCIELAWCKSFSDHSKFKYFCGCCWRRIKGDGPKA